MNFADLQKHVLNGVRIFYRRDRRLFDLNADEWTIAHRLAVYLEQEISGWHVDCEYNTQARRGNTKTNASTGRRTQRTRPDIILHHRGNLLRRHNLLIVEIKRSEVADDAKVNEATRPPVGKRRYQYQFGLALSFLPELSTRWYSDGQRIL